MRRDRFTCLCGAVIEASGSDHEVETAMALLMPFHRGEGHGPTDARTAYWARQRAERAALEAEQGGRE